MGPHFPRSFERGIISSGYWEEKISPGFEGQNLPWSLTGGGGLPNILVMRGLCWSLKSPLFGRGQDLWVVEGGLPRTLASTISRVIDGGLPESSVGELSPVPQVRLPEAGNCAAILSAECQLGLSAGVSGGRGVHLHS